jgi:outer membrane protein
MAVAWKRLAVASIAAILSYSLPAKAAGLAAGGPTPAPSPSGWTVTLGVEGRAEPVFRGSDDLIFLPYPIVDVRPAGTPERFRGPRDGIGFALFDTGNLRLGPVGRLRRQRRESDDDALRGLGNVPWAAEIGGFAEYWWGSWLRARAELRQGFNGHHGVVSDLMLDAVVPVTGRLTLSGGPRLTLASTAANAPYFSIDPVQSLASGLPVYAAKGGVQSVGAGARARYFWTPAWATHAFVEYERLTAGAAHSPLVEQRGSPNQVTVGLGVTFAFNINPLW